MGYSPLVCKGLDTTKTTNTHTCFVPPCHSYLVDTIIICGDNALPGPGSLHRLFKQLGGRLKFLPETLGP